MKPAGSWGRDREEARRQRIPMDGDKAVIIEMDLDVGLHDLHGSKLEILANGDVTRHVNGKANGPTTNFFDRMPRQFSQVGSTVWLDRITLVDRAGRVLGEYVRTAGSWSRVR